MSGRSELDFDMIGLGFFHLNLVTASQWWHE